jgi:hypothetical protein
MQKKHIEFAQAKGAVGGEFLPFQVIKNALARLYDEDLSTGTAVDVALNANTSMIRVVAVGGPIIVRARETVSALNFDDIIPAGGERLYGRDEDTTHLSFLALASNTDLLMVEY